MGSEKSLPSLQLDRPEFEKLFPLCTVHRGQRHVPTPERVLGEDRQDRGRPATPGHGVTNAGASVVKARAMAVVHR